MPFKRSIFEPHPEGATIGTLVEAVPEPDGDYGPRTRCSFDTDKKMKDGKPYRISLWVGEKVSPKSHAFRLLRALGVDPLAMSDAELAALDLDTYIGQKCELVVEHGKRPDGSTMARIVNVLPPRSPSNPEGADLFADPFEGK